MSRKTSRRKPHVLGHDFRTQLELQAMILPGIVFICIFNFTPLFGLIIAFKEYDPTSGLSGMVHSNWNHFQNFVFVFQSYDFWPVVRNTIGINLLGGLVGIPITVAFALLLNEIRSAPFKSLVQTVTYLPHFLSWVIYGGLIITLLSPDTGEVNNLLVQLHLIAKPIAFMANPTYFWAIAITTGLLKDLGWGAILYLAAIAGVDQALYEAAAIDGAGRLRQMWCITIPGILPTLMILIIFAVSGMLNNNFTQIYVMQNSLNLPTSQVIDTYVYQIGLQQFEFALATAIGLMKSVFALVLLVGANLASKKLTDAGLF
jgi:putative aldouronate transport system permease protein